MTNTLFTNVTEVTKVNVFSLPVFFRSIWPTYWLCGKGKVNTVQLEEKSQGPEIVAGMTHSA